MTDPNVSEIEEIQTQVDAERAEIVRLGRQLRAVSVAINQAAAELKAAREEQGRSLDQVAAELGACRGDLYNLEEDPTRSGSLLLMTAYANALGRKLEVNIQVSEEQD